MVLPGGESTTISRQLWATGMAGEIKRAAASGIPVLATCAGLILASREVEGNSRVETLGLMEIRTSRNAFGSQRESFEADLEVRGFDRPYHAVFIRAPAIVGVGPGVQVLARLGEAVVAARQEKAICLAFHPELTEDLRFHEMFLGLVV